MEAVETRKLTVAEFHRMEFADNDPYLYEILDGEIVKKKAPAPRHQRIVRDLAFALHVFVKQYSLGEILFAPVDVFLDDASAPQPDLVYLAPDKVQVVPNDGVMGVPTMLAEVLSPSSYRDRVDKKGLYERFGVQEYWIIDPADAYIEIYTMTGGRYELLSAASLEEGQLRSDVLPGLVLDLAALFGE